MIERDNKHFFSLKKFTKRLENFQCESCYKVMIGNGYTNHCSDCLFSKHVDIYPGDRLESCQGLMKPIAQFYHKKKGLMIVHQCTICFLNKKNKISFEDNQMIMDSLPFSDHSN